MLSLWRESYDLTSFFEDERNQASSGLLSTKKKKRLKKRQSQGALILFVVLSATQTRAYDLKAFYQPERRIG